MPFSLPRLSARVRRVLGATAIAVTLAATTTIAQFAVFEEGFEGEIWELITTLDLPDVLDGNGDPVPFANWASGVAWVDGELFVADNYSALITKFDANLQPVNLPNAEWYGDAGTPTHGWAPNEAIAADVVIGNQPATKALVVTDFSQSRVFAFSTTGEHIFTLNLPEPAGGAYTLGLNGVALTVGGYFKLNTTPGNESLEIVGTMAAAWPEYYDIASGGALIYQDTALVYDGTSGEFQAPAPDRVLTGGVSETSDPSIPAVKALTGVTFDSAGNFYMVDSWTGRLHGYDADFVHQFAYGTPDGSGETTLEFEEAYGMTLWPSAAGDRLLVTLPLKNQAVVYAPSPRQGSPATIEYLFKLDGLGAVEGLPHSSAFDPTNGRVAVSDSGDNSVKIFQTPVLAVFDLTVTGSSDQPVQAVCGGANYSVGFSITVPEGRSTVQDVSPVLLLNGVASPVNPAPGDISYGISNVGPLEPRDVISYTYSLTAPNIGLPQEITLTGSATGSTTSVGPGGGTVPVADILEKVAALTIIDCGSPNAAPSIVAGVSVAPEASGWTKIEPTVPTPINFTVTLNAADADGSIARIAYRAEGTNAIAATAVSGVSSVPVPLTQPGVTTIFFQAQDDDFEWSDEGSLTVRLDNTLPSICLNIPAASGAKSAAEWWWNGPVTIPVIITDGQDPDPQLVEPFPSQLDGMNLVFSTEGAGQVATLVARDRAGHVRVQASNTTLDVCGPGKGGRDINIDTTVPTASADLVEGPVYEAPVTVTLSGQDPPAVDNSSSGVRYIDYSFDGFATHTRVAAASVPVILAQSATIQFRSVDWASHVSAIETRTYAVNRPPAIVSPGNQTSFEGTAVSVPVTGSDPDGNGVTFSAAGLPDGLSIDGTTGLISGNLDYASAGAYPVTLTISDGTRSSTAGFTWTVLNVNRPPDVVNPGPQNSTENTAVSLFVSASDPDLQSLTYSASGLPPGLSINPATGQITGVSNFDSAGLYTATVTASDGALTDSEVFTWTVANTNLPPSVQAIADRTNAERDTVSVTVSAGDPDGDDLIYTADNLPPGLVILPWGTIVGTLTYDAAGVYNVTVTVSDGTDPVDVSFTWTVTNVNRAPSASAANRTDAENATVSFSITSSDPDGDPLLFSASGLPGGIAIDASTGVISGTLGYTTAGVHHVTVTVFDGALPASATFVWTVTNTNVRPTVNTPGDQVNAEGDSVAVAIVAGDGDGDGLTYSAAGLPPGLSIDAGTGVISGALGFSAAGDYNVTVTVSDGALTASVPFTWTVTNVNRLPVVTNPGNQTGAEDAAVVLPVIAIDPDGQSLTFSAVGLPPALTIDAATGVISGTLGFAAAGSYTVTVKASDGSASDSETFIWVVTDTNRPPVAVNDFVSTPYGTPVIIAVLANDTASDAGDTLAIQSVSNMVGGTAVANANGTVTFTPAPGFSGAAGFGYIVVDNGGLTATADVFVTVGPANLEPICTAAFTNADLWPPNHKEVYVTVGGVVDPEGLPVSVTFTSILQDEPTNSAGQGNTLQDGGIEMNGASAWVRAERSGTKKVPGDGRVYLIGFTATDAGGLTCTGTVRVDMPHDQRGTPATLSPGRWNSMTGALVTPP